MYSVQTQGWNIVVQHQLNSRYMYSVLYTGENIVVQHQPMYYFLVEHLLSIPNICNYCNVNNDYVLCTV